MAKTCQLSEKALDNLISQVCSPALNEGLLKANERMYNHLLYGIAVTEFVDGKKVNPTIALIDWEHPENNQFHFTEEFTVFAVRRCRNPQTGYCVFCEWYPAGCY
ncbi:Type I restriction enzyme R protein N terminus (HSDR_N) [Klebsiella pneumoniae]|nr:Type I restriction enzyme R protein N terminus (HSDR_N) [Klebsiella pneumoniae]